MAMTVNNVISNYTYTYNNNMRGKLDKDDDAFWSKSEVENYAKDYTAATGKTLDVDKLFEKYANEDGVIDYAGQNQMYSDDALGFSVLKNLASSASSTSSSTSSTSSSSTSSTSTTSAVSSTMSAEQRNIIYDVTKAFTFQYGGKLQPLLDKDDDGMWSRDELDNYAKAYNKATGKTLDTDALMEKYGKDGKIDPTQQAQMKKDDALGLTVLKDALGKADVSRNNALKDSKNKPYSAYTRDTTMDGKSGEVDLSMDGLMKNMSSSQKMAFSAQISKLDNRSSLLSAFGLGSGGGYGSSLLNSMSGQLMNFTL